MFFIVFVIKTATFLHTLVIEKVTYEISLSQLMETLTEAEGMWPSATYVAFPLRQVKPFSSACEKSERAYVSYLAVLLHKVLTHVCRVTERRFLVSHVWHLVQ